MANAPSPRSEGSNRRGAIFEIFRAPEWGLVAGIVVVLGVIYLLDRSGAFFSEYSRQTLLHQVALFGVLSVGAAVVIIAGGIDLSIGAVVALASIVCAKLLTVWLHKGSAVTSPPAPAVIALAIGLTLLMGLAVGLFHAVLINKLRLPPFIATLATMAGLRSLAAILSGNKAINIPFPGYRLFGRDPWWALGIFAVVAATASVLMGATVLGRHLFALGGNEMAARLSGLPTQRLKAYAYGFSAMMAALGGILFSGRSGQADPRLGVTYELYAITAAVVGGCSLSGGVGSIRGTVLGLLLIQIVIKGTAMIVHDIDSSQIEGLVLGTVVVLAVAFNQRFRGRAV
jgi:ribose/xylose/arabinose/galactoside ABC-type transport system permease subunit